ncbi:unnamed protein product, partial [Rotaria magnacalcarata]
NAYLLTVPVQEICNHDLSNQLSSAGEKLVVVNCCNASKSIAPYIEYLNAVFLKVDAGKSMLILHIAFNQFVNICSIAIEAPEESDPKAVKLFINHLTSNFNDFKTLEAVQILKFEKTPLKHELPMELQFAKFENVHSLSAADELRKNALRTIRYAEFGIPSCNLGKNESIHSGKHLVPLLSTYMPHLHTLQL